MAEIAFATCAALPDLDPGDRRAARALEQRGATVQPAVWSDAERDWRTYDAVVIRSCWDYHLETERFLGWIDALQASGVRVWNPPATVRWNLDKGYLADLAGQGFATIPTHFVPADTEWSLRTVLEENGWDRAVVKPTVSLSAHRTLRCTPANADAVQQAFAQGSDVGAMVQPYVEEIETDGEWSLVYYLGRYSHAARKRPAGGDFRVQNEHGGRREAVDPPEAIRVSADRLVAETAADCLYARVDGVRRDGAWQLMELELIDPELYLDEDDATARFADAVCAVLA